MKQKITNLKNKIELFFEKNKYKTFIIIAVFLCPSYFIMNDSRKQRNQTQNKLRKRLKHFNPTIKQGLFGKYVEWSGRDKPLTDEEVEELMKS
jgi:regulatory protein YycI of two-component signal transduction system YycFG